ncbi:hypothetical protein TSUD_252460 [Trifolium subterraneum]|uniref:TIR domain-containing protein n=1 Tax=Trifolium subterraneum TaxID=3900 RepID=A0A2Z6PGZ4_TRISU|nr:hypothetical protein TSUD_252460 [Trifolium subterraneum]
MFGSKQAPKWVSKVLKKVERKKSKLISNRDEVKRKLGTINRDIEKARGDVLEWLQEANKLIQELENLKLQRKVPSWNEFKKSQKRIKSIEKASDELFEALKGNYCSVIGLYGSQGSGKTTLVKAMRIHDEENSTSSELLNIARDVVYECTLFDALLQERFKVFMDDGGLKHGNEISSSLINEIETSRISIVVLSENFAYSTWCLNELVTILNCKKEKNQTVWPIFHNVEASDIRGQKNNYKEAMAYHEKRIGNDPEKVKKWRSALSEVAGLKGFTYKPRQQYEYKLIKEIVEKANKNRLDMQSKDMD